jgi:hypothetical protein
LGFGDLFQIAGVSPFGYPFVARILVPKFVFLVYFAGFLLLQVRVPKYACHQQRASPANFSKVDSSHGQILAVEFIQELVEGCTKLYLVVPDSLLFCVPQWGEHLSLSFSKRIPESLAGIHTGRRESAVLMVSDVVSDRVCV